MSERIYRVQHGWDGRGPWSQGFSSVWTDPERTGLPPTFQQEFPKLKLKPNVYHGCGCRTLDQLRKWFSAYEATALASLGFHIALLKPHEVIAESENQLVFTRLRPLREWDGRIDLGALYDPAEVPQ